MNFTVERSELLDAVSRLSRVVGAKTSMPVLEGILISAQQGKITLISYNLESGMRKEIYARCEEEGDIVLSAKLLSEILRKVNGLQVEITADERLNCHIKSGEATFDIMGMAAIDFPEMPSVLDGEQLSVDGKVLSEMVKGTSFAAAQVEGVKPILTGINVTVEDGVLQLVGIDGYRLAIKREKIESAQNLSFVVASSAFGEVVKLIGEETEKVDMMIGNRLISFQIDGYHFISRLLEGEFVNYKKTIPESSMQTITVNIKDLINTIERVSLLINDSFSTPVRCYFNEHSAVFTCATSVGRVTETFLLELEGEDFEIGLNSRYMLEALRAAGTEKATFVFNGSNTGVIIRPVEGDEYLYMIMPMRLK